jgi:hypothetical protein
MGAPTDRPDDPNIGARAVWLGQVSEAASALAAAQVPEQLSGSARLSRISVGSSNVGSSITVTPARDVLLDPDVPPAPPSRLRSRLGLTVVGGLVGVILAVAIAAVWRQLAIDRTVELASSSARPAPARAESAIPRLIVQSSRAMSGEPAPLGLALQGRAEGAVVIIRGLVPRMELSAGGAVGADAWQVPATDLSDVWISPPESFVGSADLVAELRWADDKIADRQAIHVEWAPPVSPAPAQRQLDREEITAATPVAPAPAQRQLDREEITAAPPVSPAPAQHQLDREDIAAAPPVAPAPAQRQLDREEITAAPPVAPAPAQRQLDREEITAATPVAPAPAQRQLDREEITAAPPVAPAPAQRQLGREEITVLLNRGKHLIANGDLAAARLVLQRAAEANDAEAALALAATYDPIVLRELKVYGLTADAAMARAWYQRARELGSAAARQRLEMLTTGAR